MIPIEEKSNLSLSLRSWFISQYSTCNLIFNYVFAIVTERTFILMLSSLPHTNFPQFSNIPLLQLLFFFLMPKETGIN